MKLITTICFGLIMTSCASAPTVDSMVADGGEVIENGFDSFIGSEGVTLTAVDGTWAAYFSPDGKKESFIKPLNARQSLTWRRKDDGTFCEMMYRPRKELCYDNENILVKSKDGLYSVFSGGVKGKYPFRIANGNTNNF